MKFIKVKAIGHRYENDESTFESEFLLNSDLIKSVTLDGIINLREDGNANVNNNCLLAAESYFSNIIIHEDSIDKFLNKYACK